MGRKKGEPPVFWFVGKSIIFFVFKFMTFCSETNFCFEPFCLHFGVDDFSCRSTVVNQEFICSRKV